MVDNRSYWDETFVLLCQVEGVRLKPYQDQKGKWTIGIGSTFIHGRPVTATTPAITMAEAEEQCHLDMQDMDNGLGIAVRVPLNVGQRTALLSFCYNLGIGALRSSTLLTLLNGGNYGARQPNKSVTGAAGQFPFWNNVRINGALVPSAGLTKRRALEQAVFLGEYAPASTANNLQSVATPVNRPPIGRVVSLVTEEQITDDLNAAQLSKYS